MARHIRKTKRSSLPTLSSGQITFQAPASATGTFTDYVLSITLSGQVDYELNDKHHQFKEGTLLLLGPGVRQRWRVAPGTQWAVIYVRFTGRVQWEPWLSQLLEGRPYRFQTLDSDRISPIIQALREADVHRSSGRQRLSHELALNALERAILIATSSLASSEDNSTTAMDQRVNRAIQWAIDRLDSPIRVEDMARAANCSRANFCRLFLKCTGESPMRYMERVKLDRATELLATTQMPVKQIASAVGFSEPKYFSKRYRIITGQSPSAARISAKSQWMV